MTYLNEYTYYSERRRVCAMKVKWNMWLSLSYNQSVSIIFQNFTNMHMFVIN